MSDICFVKCLTPCHRILPRDIEKNPLLSLKIVCFFMLKEIWMGKLCFLFVNLLILHRTYRWYSAFLLLLLFNDEFIFWMYSIDFFCDGDGWSFVLAQNYSNKPVPNCNMLFVLHSHCTFTFKAYNHNGHIKVQGK